jgi:cysteinyl-tRNA synthetase
MLIYNSKTKAKEEFIPITKGHVGIYLCGPTVYSEPHLGHARGPVVFDVVKRWFSYEGYRVRWVLNITDVGHLTDDGDQGEDKMLKRAKLEQLEPMEVAEKYFWSYFDSLRKLNVRHPDVVPRASGHITEQIQMTQAIIDAGLAYERNGSIYFDVSAYDGYGELSGRDVDEQIEGTRVTVRSDKDDPRDFALWKRAEPEHIMRWPSPWGEGFPGWHIECSVMSTKYLGDSFDIHGGGLDLIFPHHECELAQAKALGKGFARYWMHGNMITLSGEKMAKSKNHFVTLEQLFSDYDPIAVRFNLLSSHYRSVSDFSQQGLQASAQGLQRLNETYHELERRVTDEVKPNTAFADFRQRFSEAMNDDFNTPQAIAVLFDAARDVNSKLEEAEPTYLAAAKAFFDDFAHEVLGVVNVASQQPEQTALLDGLLGLVLQQRDAARAKRDFATSDSIRDQLNSLGIQIEDSTEGSRWKLQH